MKILSVLFLLISWASCLVIMWNIDFIESPKKKAKRIWTGTCLVCCIFFLPAWVIVNMHITPMDVKAKNASMKIEVRQKITNGEIIATDTVYVFTPKTK